MRLSQQFSIGQQITDVWAVFRDIEALAACMPGAELTAPPLDGHVTGRISAGLGPIRAAFTGEADVAFDDAQRNGTVSGSGRDGATGSSALGEVTFALHEEGSGATRIDVEVAYALSGTFAQFSRGDLVTGVAQAMTDAFATNLEARLLGGDLVSVPAQVGLGTVIGAAIRVWLRKLVGIN
jgi:carbon monoxide dehydrogenase subunit G